MPNSPLPCKKAFEKFLKEKSLNNEKAEDMWGQEIYKFEKIDAMWYAWQYLWQTRKPEGLVNPPNGGKK